MFTKSTTIVSVIIIAIFIAGMLIVMNGVGVSPEMPSNCYDMLNAAGQVVGTFCQ